MTSLPDSRSRRTAFIRSGTAGGLAGELETLNYSPGHERGLFQPGQQHSIRDDPDDVPFLKFGERAADRLQLEAEKVSDILAHHWQR